MNKKATLVLSNVFGIKEADIHADLTKVPFSFCFAGFVRLESNTFRINRFAKNKKRRPN